MESRSITPAVRIGGLPAYLLIFSAVAGIRGHWVPGGHRATVKDFTFVARSTELRLFLWMLQALEDACFTNPADIGWICYRLRIAVTFLGWASAIFVVEHHGPSVVFQFTTRTVSQWYWLPENGATEDFGPAWSIAVALAMVATPVAISMVILNARWISMPI